MTGRSHTLLTFIGSYHLALAGLTNHIYGHIEIKTIEHGSINAEHFFS